MQQNEQRKVECKGESVFIVVNNTISLSRCRGYVLTGFFIKLKNQTQ